MAHSLVSPWEGWANISAFRVAVVNGRKLTNSLIFLKLIFYRKSLRPTWEMELKEKKAQRHFETENYERYVWQPGQQQISLFLSDKSDSQLTTINIQQHLQAKVSLKTLADTRTDWDFAALLSLLQKGFSRWMSFLFNKIGLYYKLGWLLFMKYQYFIGTFNIFIVAEVDVYLPWSSFLPLSFLKIVSVPIVPAEPWPG